MVYFLLLILLQSHDTGLPKNLLEEPSFSVSGGGHDHWARQGTKPSLFAEGGARHHFLNGEEASNTYPEIFSPPPLH